MKRIKTASKKLLALLLALTTLCSFAAVSASAAPVKPRCTFDADAKTITVKKPDDGAEIDIEPSEGVGRRTIEHGDILFFNLKPGTSYKIVAILGGEETYSDTIVLLKSQNPPPAPVAEKITSTSIAIKITAGCEYKADKLNGEEKIEIAPWGREAVFQNLVPESYYIIYARKAEIAGEYYKSEPSSVTIKTLKRADQTPAAKPVLVNKTNSSITVKDVPGVEYSIDGGKTWVNVCEFTNLSPNTWYSILARVKSDPSVQEPNPVSEPLPVVTNSRPSYKALLNKCTLKVTGNEKKYADENVMITVKGDYPPDLNNVQYGDEMYVPVRFQVGGGSPVKLSDNPPKGAEGVFLPGEANANRTVIITVSFEKRRYDGKNWVVVETEMEKYPLQIGPVNDFANKMKIFFEFVLNFFLNDFPRLLSKLMEAGIVSKIIVAIGELGKLIN